LFQTALSFNLLSNHPGKRIEMNAGNIGRFGGRSEGLPNQQIKVSRNFLFVTIHNANVIQWNLVRGTSPSGTALAHRSENGSFQ
jgi:hypothetical protein